MQSFPARSTPMSLVAERRRITAELEAEDVTVSPLMSSPTQGNWSLVQTLEPFRTTAMATWVRGQPARTGLAGRLEQAHDSVFGSAYAPVLMSITAVQQTRPWPDQQRGLVAALKKLVDAQTELTSQIAALARRS